MSITHAVPLSEKTFTQEHVEISKQYVNPKVWPGLYDNKKLKINFKTLKFIDRRIMAIKDMLYDIPDSELHKYPDNMQDHIKRHKFMIQAARSNGRGINAPKVWQSMRQYGYELSHIPMCVIKMMDNKNHFNDGRTRLEELEEQGFTHVIVDYYTCADWHSFTSFALFRNPPDKARSPQTLADVIFNGTTEIKTGRLAKTKEAIEDYVRLVTMDAYDEHNFGKIVKGILKGKSGQSSSHSNKEADDWMITNGYLNNIKDNGIYYLVVAANSKSSSIVAGAHELHRLQKAGHKVNELRLVINTGTLKGANPEASWKSTIDSFRTTYHSNIDLIKNSHFTLAQYRNIIKLFGAIPTVHSMAQTYPLNKIVEFNKIFTKKHKTFVDLGMQNSLTEFLGI